MKLKIFLRLSALIMFISSSAYASVISYGDYSYDSATGTYTIKTNDTDASSSGYSADSFLEEKLYLDSGTIDGLAETFLSNGASYGSAFSDSIDISEGETFSFDWLWSSVDSDLADYNDFAFVTISLDGILQENIYLADTYITSGTSGTYSWIADPSGVLTYSIVIMNVGDNFRTSSLTVSNIITNSTSVPEPATISFLLLGLGLVLVSKKSSRKSTERYSHSVRFN